MNNFIRTIQCYFKNEKLEYNGDVKSAIKVFNKQSLASFLYFVYGDKFKNVYLGSVLIQNKFFQLQREISVLFNEASISHFFIKGTILCSLYPDEALRTRGDIDVVVEPKNYAKAKQILEQNGYTFLDEIQYHTGYEKNKLEVELHQALFHNDDIFYEYFSEPFKHTRVKNQSELLLDENYHFIYAVCHFNKHLMYGEGLRYIIDFYYMQKKWNLNYVKIIGDLEKLGLKQLFINIQACIHYLTGEKFYGFQDIEIEYMLNYLLNSGIHARGDDEQIFHNAIIKHENTSRFKFLLKTLFLTNLESRQRLYPKLSKRKIYYPILLIHRFFYLCFNKTKRLFQLLKLNKKKNNELINLKKQIGIVEEL